jgi:hypothetical protein
MVQVLRRTLSCFVISAAFGKKAARKESEKISERAISSEKAGKSVSPGSKHGLPHQRLRPDVGGFYSKT